MGFLFVTGMLRSGTSLIQTLLTNHPEMFVAYQPYHQLYVDVRRLFLEECGIEKFLPLGDGQDSSDEERLQFSRWLKERTFNVEEAAYLVKSATTGKGGSALGYTDGITMGSGSFFDIQTRLHSLLSERCHRDDAKYIGAKEVLCEEYIPAIVDSGGRCVIIVRDPRAVISSASHGCYHQQVGDRYPLLMLIRLWRKSAAYWLSFRNHPLVHVVRYEDLVQDPDATLSGITEWLGIGDFPEGLIHQPLYDHQGREWKGNSSFGDKKGVDRKSEEVWRTLLSGEEIRFIEACTKPELDALGYSCSTDLRADDISGLVEETQGVRTAYLSNYALSVKNRQFELSRWEAASQGRYHDVEGNRRLFLFPDVFAAMGAKC